MSPGNTKQKKQKWAISSLVFLANVGPKLKIVVNRSCDHSKRSQDEQKSNGDGFRCHFSDIQAIFGHLGPFWPILWPLKTFARGEEHDHSLTGYSHWKSIQSLKHCPCSSLILIFLKKRRSALLWKLVLVDSLIILEVAEELFEEVLFVVRLWQGTWKHLQKWSISMWTTPCTTCNWTPGVWRYSWMTLMHF